MAARVRELADDARMVVQAVHGCAESRALAATIERLAVLAESTAAQNLPLSVEDLDRLDRLARAATVAYAVACQAPAEAVWVRRRCNRTGLTADRADLGTVDGPDE